MKKLSLTVIGFYLGILAAFSQGTDTAYKSRKLSLEEVNFVSGYYHQAGVHSAVTGGIGTEKLSDIANTIDLKLSKYSKRGLKHNINFELGIDHYSSASSDKIDPSTISSPSYSDTRFYPSLGWAIQNEAKRSSIGLTASLSTEYDYKSKGLALQFSKGSKDNSREFAAKVQAYFDQWTVIYPVELRTGGREKEGHSPRNSYSASLSFSQIVNTNLQLLLIAEPTYQEGLLATKYQRVYLQDGKVRTEELPDTRIKIPVGLRANYFIGDRFILRSFYRFYRDDWGLQAHTAELEIPIKVTAAFSISPFYRYYTQNPVDYFAPYQQGRIGQQFYTSDYDLSAFHSSSVGAGVRVVPPGGLFGIENFHSAELRYGYYKRSDGLSANQVTLHLQLK